MIWRSRWVTDHGIFECREALSFPGGRSRAVLLRRVLAVDHNGRVRIALNPRADFGQLSLAGIKHHEQGWWTGRSGDLSLRWSGAPAMHRVVAFFAGNERILPAHCDFLAKKAVAFRRNSFSIRSSRTSFSRAFSSARSESVSS